MPTVIPTGATLGAEIKDLDLSQLLSDDADRTVQQALLDHCVVFFRTQNLTEEDQIRFTKYIVGLPPSESKVLLNQLYEHAERPEFVWTHHWQVGDLVMWDNRPTMHRRAPFPATERRLMKRAQVFNADDIPFE